MIRHYGFVLFLLFFLAACKKGDKVPSYIEITQVSVVPQAGAGLTTSRITDAWVYADDQLLGVWEIPARIPILSDGPTRIQVSPSVKRNGTYDDRVRYPFYTWWSGTVDLHREEFTSIAPVVNYDEGLHTWVEAFEDPGFQLMVSENSDTTLIRFTPTEHPEVTLLEGSPAAGGFVLDAEHPYMRIYSDPNEQFQATGGPIFLELDYSTNVILTIGVSFVQGGTQVAQPYVYLVPTAEGTGITPHWNKVYIDLSPVFNLAISQRNFYIEASVPSSGIARVYLDNLKLVRNQ